MAHPDTTWLEMATGLSTHRAWAKEAGGGVLVVMLNVNRGFATLQVGIAAGAFVLAKGRPVDATPEAACSWAQAVVDRFPLTIDETEVRDAG